MSSTKTSTTAYGVACGLAKLAGIERWKEYFSDEMIRLNNAFMRYAKDRPIKHLISWLPPKLYVRVMDSLFIPGLTYHFLFRKRLIESQLISALAHGVQQVIVLGAGLDTLALRMARQYPLVRFFEIDLPHTQQMKTNILKRIQYPVSSNCIFIGADLAQSTLQTVLQRQKDFKAEAPTLVVLEGVLMYLAESEVKTLFTSMYELFKAPLTVIFGATVASDDDAHGGIKMVNAILGQGQETTKWYCPSSAIPGFMAELGYEVKEWMPYKKLQNFYRNERDIRKLAVEDENYYIVAKMPQFQGNNQNLSIKSIPLASVSN